MMSDLEPYLKSTLYLDGMISRNLKRQVLTSLGIEPSGDEVPMYEFYGFVNGRPCTIIMTNKRMIVMYHLPGSPKVATFEYCEWNWVGSKKKSKFVKVVLSKGDTKIVVATKAANLVFLEKFKECS